MHPGSIPGEASTHLSYLCAGNNCDLRRIVFISPRIRGMSAARPVPRKAACLRAWCVSLSIPGRLRTRPSVIRRPPTRPSGAILQPVRADIGGPSAACPASKSFSHARNQRVALQAGDVDPGGVPALARYDERGDAERPHIFKGHRLEAVRSAHHCETLHAALRGTGRNGRELAPWSSSSSA